MATIIRQVGPQTTDQPIVFRSMLESGHPPDDWNQLLAEARAEYDRLQRVVTQSGAAT